MISLNIETGKRFLQEHTPRISRAGIIRSVLALSLLPSACSPQTSNKNLGGFSEPVGDLGLSVKCSEQSDEFPTGAKGRHIDINMHSKTIDGRPTNHPDEGIYVFLTDLSTAGRAEQIAYEGNSQTVRGSFHGQSLGTEFISGKALRFEARIAKQGITNAKTEGTYVTGQTLTPDCPGGNHTITLN